ncbi:MAG: glycosyltransferase [Ferruginibacter sp.]
MIIEAPVLSIICLAYNHGKYIEAALTGFVTQKTTFPIEIIVHDDASNDSTVEIVKEFEARYPELFFNIYQKENQYSKGNGDVAKIVFSAARGRYIAMCEGDDFWTDSLKLKRQVDFLEKHTKYVGCFHNVEERYEEDDDKASFLYCNYPSSRNISFEDLSYANLIPTCSVVYRNGLFNQFPNWYFSLKMGDWPLNLLNAQFGDFWYVPKIMGVHRIHQKGLWAIDNKMINHYTREAYEIMIEGFSDKLEFRNQLATARSAYNGVIKSPPTTSIGRRVFNRVSKALKG